MPDGNVEPLISPKLAVAMESASHLYIYIYIIYTYTHIIYIYICIYYSAIFFVLSLLAVFQLWLWTVVPGSFESGHMITLASWRLNG